MGKENIRSKETKEKIWRAYLKLLRERKIDEINVKEVCNEANINRSTFYSYYLDLDDLIATKESEMNNKIVKLLNKKDINNDIARRDDLLLYLQFLKDNYDNFYACFLNNSSSGLNGEIRRLLKNSINHYFPKKESETDNTHLLIVEFYEKGLYYILKRWILNGCVESIEDIVYVIKSGLTASDLKK